MKKKSLKVKSLKKLIKTVHLLRDPKDGCPWDQVQTHRSLIPYLIEETHEVIDAIRYGKDKELKEELGDLLLQIILHVQIAEESKKFNLNDIAKNIQKKLIRRHPHVFKNHQKLTVDEVKQKWEEIKEMENPITNSNTPITDKLQKKVRSQSSLDGAMTISRQVASLGFEWNKLEDVFKKVNEELEELVDAIEQGNLLEAEKEMGDLIFTLVNVSRWLEINTEEGLAETNKKFLNRFAEVEKSIDGNFADKTVDQLNIYWEAAKKTIALKESD